MQYRIVEERGADGKVFNYQVQTKFWFLWLPGAFGYSTIEDAQQAISQMTGTNIVAHNVKVTGEAPRTGADEMTTETPQTPATPDGAASHSNGGFDPMSSARKRAAIQKANNEADHLRQRLMLAEHHAATIEAFAFKVAEKADALQARIDALMLEYCPDEMTEAQKANWARHQKPASDEHLAEVAAALMGSNAALTGAEGVRVEGTVMQNED